MTYFGDFPFRFQWFRKVVGRRRSAYAGGSARGRSSLTCFRTVVPIVSLIFLP